MLATLALVSLALGMVELPDRTQALGLPEGSIRAVIALSLVVLFAILSIFLYEGMSSNGQPRRLDNLTEAEKTSFLTNNPSALEIVVQGPNSKIITTLTTNTEVSPGPPPLFPTIRTNYVTNVTYAISYRAIHNPASDDFAKQLLVLIGTLMTAVSSFYFGAKTAATSQTSDVAKLAPNPRSIMPAGPVTLGTTPLLGLEIFGDNLNSVKQVKIAHQSGDQIAATGQVVSNDNLVKCQIPLDPSTTKTGKWDVTVVDGTGKSATLSGALTIVPIAANPQEVPGVLEAPKA